MREPALTVSIGSANAAMQDRPLGFCGSELHYANSVLDIIFIHWIKVIHFGRTFIFFLLRLAQPWRKQTHTHTP